MRASLRRSPSTKILTLLLISLFLLLNACGDPTTQAEITLSVNDSSLPDGGGPVTLTAEVTKGEVDSVTFKRDKGAAIPEVTTPNAQGDFVTTVTIAETTTFTATATGPEGNATVKPAAGVRVTVDGPSNENDPVAPDATAALKGVAGIALTTDTPTELSVVVTTIPGVTGEIVGQVKAETVKSRRGVDVSIKAGDGVLSFTYSASTSGTDSFEYTVTRASREAKGTVTLDIQALPSGYALVDTLAEVNSSGSSRLILTGDVTCSSSPCVVMDSGQTLAGTLAIPELGVTVTNSVKPKIVADIPNTREPGTPACDFDPRPNCLETRVIELADSTTVDGVDIVGEGENYFIAIYGRGDTSNVLDGSIKLKNVTLTGSSGKPIYIQYALTYNPSNTFGNYNLEIEGLTVNDANDTVVIGHPKTLLFKDSEIELIQPFGDNVGIDIRTDVDSTLTVDNVDVFMESTEYKLDINPVLPVI
jgi:outer membrane lipoprotein SlyB